MPGLPTALFCLATFPGILNAEPASIQLKFLPHGNRSAATISPDKNLLVSVYDLASQLTKASWQNENQSIDLTFAGQDPVTKLCFFKRPSTTIASAIVWKKHFHGENPQALTATTSTGELPCTFNRWVSEIDRKILPLALLSITFQGAVPAPGTPLTDSESEIIGLVFKKASGNTAYAIPAQAVHRVQRDISKHKKLVRGYLGLSLSTQYSVPRIQRVLPDSPAAKAKLRESDIIVKVGSYPTARYPDAVNAFFYTIPGESTSLEILRDNKKFPCEITPVTKK